MNLKDKKVAVLGLGIEGIALYEFLHDKVKTLAVCDRQEKDELLKKIDPNLAPKLAEIVNDNEIEKLLGPTYLDDLHKYDIIFRSPSIYFQHPDLMAAKKAGVLISSQIKLFFDLCPCPIIGVTGTKGKGTTASMIYEILMKNSQLSSKNEIGVYLAGNIGYPAITLIPELKKDDIVILELSNFQLADLDRSPHIAVMTNLTIDHLDYHKDEDEYHNAKKSIVAYQSTKDYAVLNWDSTFDPAFLEKIHGKIRYFSKSNSCVDGVVEKEIEGYSVKIKSKGRMVKICDQKEVKLLGRHNLENIAAAALVGDILGIDRENISSAIKDFAGLPHRLEKVDRVNFVTYVNDSFATNPGPTLAAIDSFSEDKILILGGSPKGADFTELAESIALNNVRSVITIGVEGPRIKESLQNASFKGKIVVGAGDIKGIVKQARDQAKRGDVVLFSPACASFDMFKNYKERGNEFKEAVLNLVPKR